MFRVARSSLLTWFWTHSVTAPVSWLFPLGFVPRSFYSADYYPPLPWIFCFFLGARLGGVVDWKKHDRPLPEALCLPGRHSLLLYLLHQPVLYGLVWLIQRLFR